MCGDIIARERNAFASKEQDVDMGLIYVFDVIASRYDSREIANAKRCAFDRKHC